ncbi:hypothetical protein A2U01_0088531, partial [Trifolium medium]|nr:hypothetical protein [Trifolium medium]
REKLCSFSFISAKQKNAGTEEQNHGNRAYELTG